MVWLSGVCWPSDTLSYTLILLRVCCSRSVFRSVKQHSLAFGLGAFPKQWSMHVSSQALLAPVSLRLSDYCSQPLCFLVFCAREYDTWKALCGLKGILWTQRFRAKSRIFQWKAWLFFKFAFVGSWQGPWISSSDCGASAQCKIRAGLRCPGSGVWRRDLHDAGCGGRTRSWDREFGNR